MVVNAQTNIIFRNDIRKIFLLSIMVFMARSIMRPIAVITANAK